MLLSLGWCSSLLPPITRQNIVADTPFFNAKKFHSSGNKEGAVNAFRRLAAEGLGEVEEVKGKRGTKIVSQVVIMFNSHSCMSANRI